MIRGEPILDQSPDPVRATGDSSGSDGPFDARDDQAHGRWRAWKLARYPANAADLTVEITGLAGPSAQEIRAILDLCRRANMAIYACRDGPAADRAAIRAFAAGFGPRRLDRHLGADESGATALEVAARGRRREYIPYSDREPSWHAGGYYNEDARRIRAVLLHCVRDAASGGESALLDHDIAYIRLRDEAPAYIEALMHPEAMTIPTNGEGGAEIRPARTGPVFSLPRRHVLVAGAHPGGQAIHHHGTGPGDGGPLGRRHARLIRARRTPKSMTGH